MVARSVVIKAAVVLSVLLGVSAAYACPFCAKLGKTLSDEATQAEFVAAGMLKNPRIEGKTDFEVTAALKPKEFASKTVTLLKYLAVARNEPVHRVIFGDLLDDEVDPFRIMVIRSDDFVPYLRGAIANTQAPPATRYAYFSKYLEHSDQNIAIDAYQEFAKAPYPDVVAAAKSYDPDRLLELIRNPLTPGDRIGLYGLMVGVAGRPQDAEVLRRMVENPNERRLNGLDGLMGGLCVLNPTQGLELSLDILNDRQKPFNLRYSALEAIRFALIELDAFDRDHVFERMRQALEIPELCDLLMDELRKHQQWSAVNQVLGLAERSGYDSAVIRRAILRFAIECPDPKANAFLQKAAESDSQFVADVKSSLEFEKQLQQQFGGPKQVSPALKKKRK